MDYQKAYCVLFNAMSDAIEEIDHSRIITQEMEDGLDILRKAQQITEKMYMDEE